MTIDTIHLVYYSATYTTQRIVREIAKAIDAPVIEHDITMHPLDGELQLSSTDLLILGMPVFGGLIPADAAQRLEMVSGANTPAILVAVYGNRHYDNALAQMRDIAVGQGFAPASAAAFIARHSIFTTIASNRPNTADIETAYDFACRSIDIITSHDNFPALEVPGKPDLVFRKPPLYPTGDEGCNSCGTCVDLCPSGAIDIEDPKSTNATLCTACGRCIVVCPSEARMFRGEVYEAGVARFEANFATPRQPEMFFPAF